MPRESMTESIKVRLSSKGQLVIPKAIRDAAGLEEGDEVLIAVDGSTIVMTPVEAFARSSRGVLKGTWGRTRRQIDRTVDRERNSWK